MIDHTDRFYIGQWFTFEDWEKRFQGLRLQLKVHLLPLKKITSFSGEFDVFETFIKAFSVFFQCTIFWLVVEAFSMFVAERKIDFETPTWEVKPEAGATFDNSFFDNSFFDNSFGFLRQFKNRSFLDHAFVHVTGRSQN